MPVTRVDTEDISNETIIEEDLADGAVSPVKADLTASWDYGQGAGSTLFYKTPTADTEVAIKSYVDAVAAGIRDPKDAVYLAASASITLSGLQTLDDVAGAQDDRILVFGQSTASENGIYTMSTGSWPRATDADEDVEVTNGLYTLVTSGTVWQSAGFVLVTPDPIVVDTDDLTFVQFNGLAQVVAGDGLTKTGNVLDVGEGLGIKVDPDLVRIDETVIPTLTSSNTWTGDNIFNAGLSGSLMHNENGDSLFVAGTNMTINSSSGDQIIFAPDFAQVPDIGASYVTMNLTASLPNERFLTSSTGIIITDGGANGAATVAIDPNVITTTSASQWSDILNPPGAYPATVFTSSNDFQSGTLRLYRRGLRMREGASSDFTITGPNEVTFTSAVSNATKTVMADYLKLI